ncbi:MAG: hypothetical protein JJU36_04005 [Phycisphaeraceae bacterium]|nr:hypothetical protein [Phycisphaeraceae bacterium]
MRFWILLSTLVFIAATTAPLHAFEKVFAVNEYFGVEYENEPVSFDVEFDTPVRADRIRLDPGPWQVEILEGTPERVTRARIWTLVTFQHRVEQDDQGRERTRPAPAADRHMLFTVTVGDRPARADVEHPFTVQPVERRPFGQVAEVSNGVVHVRMPTGRVRDESGVSAFHAPGPVVSISRDGREWIGDGYLDSMHRVVEIQSEIEQGPVFLRNRITYRFDDPDRNYTVDLRLFAGKPFVTLDESFNLGGNSRFVFNYDDWDADAFFQPGDARLYGWESITANNPAQDFIQIEGQKALSRLVIWSQFNYFRGKQETIALKQPDVAAHRAAYEAAMERYERDSERYQQLVAEYEEAMKAYREAMERYEADPEEFGRAPQEPRAVRMREPREPEWREVERITYSRAGASMETKNLATPGGDSLAVGAFYIRPDQWTRAKINHVDLVMRPEVPGDRMTRGVVGLSGAVQRIAMEAWLIDGRRRWAMFAVPSGDRHFFAKAHVTEGVWPLDRINRLPLVWNSDGSPVKPEHTAPRGDGVAGGAAQPVLRGTGGRSGLQYFNGSSPHIRGTSPDARGLEGQMVEVRAETADINRLVSTAMNAYLSADDSAYPSIRAMLPWTDPEAINPFYQGMENQNFNADLYRYVSKFGIDLKRMGHPEADRFIQHAVDSFDLALDVYVYPESGTWEESHGYAAHTIRTVMPMVMGLRAIGARDFLEDVRFARMLEFFVDVYSPRDKEFGNRVVPPVGDHGLSRNTPGQRLGRFLPNFAQSRNPDVHRILGRVTGLMVEDGEEIPEGIEPVEPDLRSRWLRGYGTVLRAIVPDKGESFAVVRSGQSWGHHHQDKGSLWFWGRNVHFFGDNSWGSPPGGTYWNPFKQGPASGTQIEFVGINNWPLPCKYPAAWISDEDYRREYGYDYVNARNMFPYNPRLDLAQSTPVALHQGYDRQVLFIHPDIMIVRDNVQTTCPTVWRFHSYQMERTDIRGGAATLRSTHGVTGQLQMVYPDGIEFKTLDRFPEIHPDTGQTSQWAGQPFTTLQMEWPMPMSSDATWVFGVHGDRQAQPRIQRLDEKGRVVRITLADGTIITSLMNIEPFTFAGHGIRFEGKVGIVIERPGEPVRMHPIRAQRLTRD